MTRMATSMTWPGSSVREPSSPSWRDEPADENYATAPGEPATDCSGMTDPDGRPAGSGDAADAGAARTSTACVCRRVTRTSTSPTASCIVPTFNDPNDRVALGILAELLPDREVVGIHCVDLVWGLGTLHCMTQQEPREVLVGVWSRGKLAAQAQRSRRRDRPLSC